MSKSLPKKKSAVAKAVTLKKKSVKKASVKKELHPNFRSTYRLQLQKDFPFQAASGVAGYIEELGISHLYLSPILESRESSNHGYDGLDPENISVERGGEADFEKLIRRVAKLPGLEGVVLDIVPNHLGVSPKNPVWWDVLKHGTESKFWHYFDIRARGDSDLRVVLPVLGRTRATALAAREITIGLMGDELVFKYFDHVFPIAIKSYPRVLKALAYEAIESEVEAPWLTNLLERTQGPPISGTELAKELSRWVADRAAGSANSPAKKKTSSSRGKVQAEAASKADIQALDAVFHSLALKDVELTLAEQNYSLRDWRSGSQEVNYRRFFDINDLVAIRVEDPEVFNWAHSKILELCKKFPEIHGLRVDHVDGLTAPADYLERLSQISEYVWVEKILGEGEKLQERWHTAGSTGYEFANISARLFVHLPGLKHLHSHYIRHIDNRWERFHDCVYDSKREMLESHFVSETNYLVEQFHALATQNKKISFTKDDMRETLIELTSSLRVYRTYAARGEPIRSRWMEDALAETESRGKLTNKNAFNWLRSTLLAPGDWTNDVFRAIKRWEQLTGPVMAKGLEDTALYRYCPLLSLNVVGGEPDWVGDGSIEYHAFSQDKLRTYPLGMSTSSTHDTKRSEDVRARIHVISEISDEWLELFESSRRAQALRRATKKGKSSRVLKSLEEVKLTPYGVDANGSGLNLNVEYLIYETLIGDWPLDGKVTDDFVSRMQRYFLKAAREAKTETTWSEPNASYEALLRQFVHGLLKPKEPVGRALLKKIGDFAQKCAYFGAFNSLSVVALKVLSPGLPDFYQGCEMWDFSLVDPDNRRQVDYDLRQNLLTKMKRGLKESRSAYLNGMSSRWQTGEIKLWLTWELLQLRKKDPKLYIDGEYLAIEVQGEAKVNFVAFTRNIEDRWVLVVTPRFLATRQSFSRKLMITNKEILEAEFVLPERLPKAWKNVLTGEKLRGQTFKAKDLFCGLPIAVLTGKR